MSTTRRVLSAIIRLFLPAQEEKPAPRATTVLGKPQTSKPQTSKPQTPKPQTRTVGGSATAPKPASTSSPSPGRGGSTATREVDPARVGRVKLAYSPSTDGDADPGEIVWTWVPYEENDGRGKDRPVLVVAKAASGAVLAVQLTSKEHRGYLPLGAGAWDIEGRPSFVNLERLFLVQPGGMRREASALDGRHYAQVSKALSARYGW